MVLATYKLIARSAYLTGEQLCYLRVAIAFFCFCVWVATIATWHHFWTVLCGELLQLEGRSPETWYHGLLHFSTLNLLLMVVYFSSGARSAFVDAEDNRTNVVANVLAYVVVPSCIGDSFVYWPVFYWNDTNYYQFTSDMIAMTVLNRAVCTILVVFELWLSKTQIDALQSWITALYVGGYILLSVLYTGATGFPIHALLDARAGPLWVSYIGFAVVVLFGFGVAVSFGEFWKEHEGDTRSGARKEADT